MLTVKEKKDIYDSLSTSYSINTPIPMASIALYLKNNGIDYQIKGYKKLKNLLLDLDFIEIKTTNEEDKHIEYVLIKNKKENIKEIEKKIYQDLSSHFSLNKSYPIASISLYLNKHKYDYKKYGFNKMKSFLEALSFIKIESQGAQTNLVVSQLKQKKETKAVPNNKTNFENNEQNSKRLLKKDFVSSSHKKEGYYSLDVPKALIECYKEVINDNKNDLEINKKLISDLNNGLRNNTVFKIDDAFAFELSDNKENIIATIKKATSKTTYDFYLNYIGQYKVKAKNEFKNDIAFDDYEQAVTELSQLANKESWCYKNSKDKFVILKIYLQYTYHKLKNENKVLISNNKKYACFNTGLFTSNLEDIYCLLEVNNTNNTNPFSFLGFSIAGIKGIGKTIVENFSPLPLRAKYISSANDIYFDSSKEIHIDYQHIILENISRFPLSFLLRISKSFPKEYSLLKSIEKSINKPYSDALLDKLFYKLEESISKNNDLFNFIKASLEFAIKETIKKVNYDYHLALPSYFPTRDVISIMLPISFDSNNLAQMVLLLEETQIGNYQGQTIFTLKQCYANARLISPLNNTFLNPKEIND